MSLSLEIRNYSKKGCHNQAGTSQTYTKDGKSHSKLAKQNRSRPGSGEVKKSTADNRNAGAFLARIELVVFANFNEHVLKTTWLGGTIKPKPSRWPLQLETESRCNFVEMLRIAANRQATGMHLSFLARLIIKRLKQALNLSATTSCALIHCFRWATVQKSLLWTQVWEALKARQLKAVQPNCST